MKIIITALFGLESLVREDLESIGYDRSAITVSDGMVLLEVPDGTSSLSENVARVNMCVRRGERVLFEIGSFHAEEFDELFEKTAVLPWEQYIPRGYAFIVNGYSRKSKLFGISACQSLIKKAAVRSLCRSRGLGDDGIISEDRNKGEVRIQFGIVRDEVSVMIDTTGDGLHKRGYRPLTHEAPIRETLASGMVSLSRFRPFGFEALVDPFCGSGTILIEAALMSCGCAPGRNRHFSYENLPYIGSGPYMKAREEALSLEDLTPSDDIYFYGSDIDPAAVRNAKLNARKAGVGDMIRFNVADAADMTPRKLLGLTIGFDRQLIITNPPYGGRLMTPEQADEIYRMISSTYLTSSGKCKKGIRLSVISPEDSFESATGTKADKRYKLYNGNIKCTLNSYFRMD